MTTHRRPLVPRPSTTVFRERCSSCGTDTELESTALAILGPDGPAYQWRCPSCDLVIDVVANREIISLLLASGVEVDHHPDRRPPADVVLIRLSHREEAHR